MSKMVDVQEEDKYYYQGKRRSGRKHFRSGWSYYLHYIPIAKGKWRHTFTIMNQISSKEL